jgi:WhiB family redox-sensing transcriptional regulator
VHNGVEATQESGTSEDQSNSRAWMERALCRGEDRDLFFPSVGASSTKARAICSTCPIGGQCLAYALADNELSGVWGGTTTQERKRLQTMT